MEKGRIARVERRVFVLMKEGEGKERGGRDECGGER